ncbi:MAG: ABC-type branched-chain amino acid transport system, ATPase component [Acidimicrobiales bacterium]|nr:ABC-type branched-chain amino acid transport system, ATPase component [Acidimicrobiales bacterium]
MTTPPPALELGGPADGPTPLLELSGIRASYGRIEVLHGIDLVVPRGEVVALLGPNGAGKSTTLLVATGQHPASAGCIHVAGRHVNGVRPDALARIGLCTVPEGRGVFRNLTVRENLRMASYRGQRASDITERAVARFPRLGERLGQVAGTLSGGEQQMLAMARGLATDPALLIIDELSMGLAPLIVAELYELVAGIAQDGVSILVVEQFARTVLGVADRAVIMQHGQVIAAGVPADLEAELSAAYLGAQS